MIEPGFTLWFTGLPCAGKSTLASGMGSALVRRGYRAETLDGDEIRANLSRGLGFSREDRDTNIRRIGFIAHLLSRNGVIAIAAAVSPYRATREEVRQKHEAPFIEVFVDCPLEELVRRDCKGLYARALSGDISNFTGVSDPYEPPISPDVHLHTDAETVEESLARVLEALERRKLIGR